MEVVLFPAESDVDENGKFTSTMVLIFLFLF